MNSTSEFYPVTTREMYNLLYLGRTAVGFFAVSAFFLGRASLRWNADALIFAAACFLAGAGALAVHARIIKEIRAAPE